MARTRQTLGVSAFQSAWSEGKAMSREQTLNLAQEEIEGF